MTDGSRTVEELSRENAELRRRIADLESAAGEDTDSRAPDVQASKQGEILRAITESAVDAIFCKDMDRRYSFTNPAMEKLLGAPAGALIGKRAEDLFDEEAVAAIEEADGPAFKGEVNTGSWTVNVGENRHTFHVVEVPLLDTGGAVWGICGIVRDITDLKTTELALREKEFLVESASSVIATADLDGNMTYANPAFLDAWGYGSFDEVRGHPFPMFWLVDEILDTIMSALLGEGKWFGELKARRKDGTLFDVQVLAAAIKDNDGNVIGLMSSSIDITERKKAVTALAERAEELARSNAELEQFGYAASHDLQEPLRMMAAFSEVLATRCGDQLDERGHKYLNQILEGARRMQALINGMLSLSRVGTHGRPMEAVDSGKVLEGVLDTLHLALKESGAKVTSGEMPTVIADRVQLSQVLQNLIGNALKFRGEQPPVLKISSRRVGHLSRFDIWDNGIGIDEKFHDRIFQIFQRLHTRDEYDGNGIGLSLTRKIVERHGGAIWLESSPGEGARFSFTLPAAD